MRCGSSPRQTRKGFQPGCVGRGARLNMHHAPTTYLLGRRPSLPLAAEPSNMLCRTSWEHRVLSWADTPVQLKLEATTCSVSAKLEAGMAMHVNFQMEGVSN